MALTELTTANGTVQLPAFVPDGTRGVVRTLDANDLRAAKVQQVQMNVYHLMQSPGTTTIQALGGLHKMSGWDGPISTDSGGFQVYSLIRQNAKFGSLTDQGAIFRIEGRKFKLTPEKSIQLQLAYGANVAFCLDDCTHVSDSLAEQRKSVNRSIAWAKRCRKEFDRLQSQKNAKPAKLYAVVQGGNSSELRTECAEALKEIGFEGYGYGGWPLDDDGNLVSEMLQLTRDLLPDDLPLHALGVGHPANVTAATRMGYTLFDSVMPTRDARHGRLYTFTVDPNETHLTGKDWFKYIYLTDKKHLKTATPISEYCDCPVCQTYSLGYVHHLFKIKDALAPRFATLHNLRFMTQLMENLRREQR